ncbi:hypothetical protein ABT301_36010 [Streptomyces sp. NPDC000987]|uniref:hypothetical protein n=1 Tax=Streptomyces sp. NPDC000987 TaxID=3154374 RepID=UPI00332453CE
MSNLTFGPAPGLRGASTKATAPPLSGAITSAPAASAASRAAAGVAAWSSIVRPESLGG